MILGTGEEEEDVKLLDLLESGTRGLLSQLWLALAEFEGGVLQKEP